MTHRHGSAAELARHLASCSDRFLAAAEHLPADRDDMETARRLLLAVAVEYRLKAYIGAARGGVPPTPDLYRLASLAVRCGLTLSRDQLALVTRLDRERFPEPIDPDLPGMNASQSTITSRLTPGQVRILCSAISGQATPERLPR